MQLKDVLFNGSAKRGEQTWQAKAAVPSAANDNGSWRGENIAVEANMKAAGESLDAAINITDAEMRDGQWNANKLTGNGTWQQKQNRVTTKLEMASAAGDAQSIRLQQLQIDADGLLNKQPIKTRVSGAAIITEYNQIVAEKPIKADFTFSSPDVVLKGTLASPLRIDLAKSQYDFSALALDVSITPTNFLKPLILKTSGPLNLNFARQTISSSLVGNLNTAKLEAKLSMANFNSPAYTFDVALNTFNTAWLASKPVTTVLTSPAKPAPAQDFAWIKTLNANGTVRIGELIADDIRSENVRIDIKSDAAPAVATSSVKKKP
jgi:AsmA protein